MASNNSVTSCYIDLATYDELEKYMYSVNGISYFSMCIKKCTWASTIPVILRQEQTLNYGAQNVGARISRQGDVLLGAFLRCAHPAISGAGNNLRWVHDTGHNLIQETTLTFNDIPAEWMDSHFLNAWNHFTMPGSKWVGYFQNMIWNPDMSPAAANTIPAMVTNTPLPFFFTRDKMGGCGLRTCALPYNEMKINFTLRTLNQLVILDAGAGVVATNPTMEVWAYYAVVSNSERVRMGSTPTDMIIEQVQRTTGTLDVTSVNTITTIDIRYSYAIKVLFWMAANRQTLGVLNTRQWSNYTEDSGALGPNQGVDPINTTSLVYDNTIRLDQMPADFFSLVEPWYRAPAIPERTGYHMYAYALDFYSMNPTLSTNYSKIANPSMRFTPSADAVASGFTFDLIIRAVNATIARITGGSFGFPTL